ncbi:glutamine-rich protein 2 [Podargus strigoides]
MVEACREMGQLSQLCAALREQVAQLEANKLEKTELEKLRLEFQGQDQESTSKVLSNLQGQVSLLVTDLWEEKEKVRQLEDALGKLRAAGADRRMDSRDQTCLERGSVLQEMRRELGEQQEVTKATLEQAMTKMAEQLQQQPDELRAMVQRAGQGQAEVQAACVVCSGDSGAQVGQLLQRYEKLQEQVDCKLDRLELGPFQQQLEKQWRKRLEELKEKLPVTGAEDAAGLKQQLLPRFRCLSCDRPLCVQTPGPHTVALPAMLPMPPPAPVCSDWRSMATGPGAEHPRVPSHREQAAECGYPTVPRQCGGWHTVTHPLQRPPHLQPRPPSTPQPLHTARQLRIEGAETELLDPTQTETESAWWDGHLPPLEAKEGPTASPEHRPASAHHRLSRAPRLLLPLRTPWDRSSTRQPGGTGVPGRSPRTSAAEQGSELRPAALKGSPRQGQERGHRDRGGIALLDHSPQFCFPPAVEGAEGGRMG